MPGHSWLGYGRARSGRCAVRRKGLSGDEHLRHRPDDEMANAKPQGVGPLAALLRMRMAARHGHGTARCHAGALA